MKRRILIPAVCAVLLVFLGACEDQSRIDPLTSTQCNAGLAQIGVEDGFLEILCGCQEAGGTPDFAPANITCTVSSGTVIMFHYLATHLKHQIISVGTPSFPSSPVSDPADDENMIRSTGFQLNTAGTYQFEDAFNTSLQGKIVVH